MPVLYCVKCCDCNTFQSVQARKDRKFTCKMCGKKQSIIKVYAKSESGKEIRKIVQQMNMARGTADEEYEAIQAERTDEEMTDKYSHEQYDTVEPAQSRWAPFERAVNAVEPPVKDVLPFDDNDAMFVTSEPDWQGRRGRKRPRRTESTDDDESRRGREQRTKRNEIDDEPSSEIDRLRTICQPSSWRIHSGASTQRARRSGRPPSYPRHQQRSSITTPRRVSAPRERRHSYAETMDDGFVTTTGGDEVFEEEVM